MAILLLCLAAPGHGAQPSEDALRAEIARLANKGSYAKQTAVQRQLVALVEHKYGRDSAKYAADIYDLAMLYVRQGRYHEAEPLLQRSLAVNLRNDAPDDPRIAWVYDALGQVYRRFQQLDEARQVTERAVAMMEAHYADGSSEVQTVLSDLGLIYDDLGRYDDAKTLYERMLATERRAAPPDKAQVATTLDRLARLETGRLNFATAERLYAEALDLHREVSGPRHPVVASDLMGLGWSKLQHGEEALSEKLFAEALEIFNGQEAAGSTDIAWGLKDLAAAYTERGMFEQAEKLLLQAGRIYQARFGKGSLDYAAVLGDQAWIAYRRQQYPQAEQLYRQSLAQFQTGGRRDWPRTGNLLNGLALVYQRQGRTADAEAAFKRAIASKESSEGPSHPSLGQILRNLAQLYLDQERGEQAEPLFRRAYGIDQPESGQAPLNLAADAAGLGRIHYEADDYGPAESFYRQALDLSQQAQPSDPRLVGIYATRLGEVLYFAGHYPDARPLWERALAIDEAAKPVRPADLMLDQRYLGDLYRKLSLWPDSETAYRKALDYESQAPDPDGRADILGGLADLYNDEGRYAEAEEAIKTAIAIAEEKYGKDSFAVSMRLNSLADVYSQQFKYDLAEATVQRELKIDEARKGATSSEVSTDLSELADIYKNTGRLPAAVKLMQRVIAIDRRHTDEKSADMATDYYNLADAYYLLDQDDQAEIYFERAMKIDADLFGADDPQVAESLTSLALVKIDQEKWAEAESLTVKALAIHEQRFTPASPQVASDCFILARLYRRSHRYDEAETYGRRAIAIEQRLKGRDHPNIAANHTELARLLLEEGRTAEALEEIRHATAIHRSIADSVIASARDVTRVSEADTFGEEYALHATVAAAHARRHPEQRAALTGEAFEIIQLTHSTQAARALAQASARFAAGSDRLADLVRARQDAVLRWQAADRALSAVIEDPQSAGGAEQARRDQLTAAREEIARLDGEIADQSRRGGRFVAGGTVKPALLQSALGDDEAVLLYSVGRDSSLLWVIRRDGLQMFECPIGRGALSGEVAALRDRLDPAVNRERKAYDLERAWRLEQRILAPAMSALSGIRRLIIVPDGALQSLPFAILVNEAPPAVRGPADYRKAAWLGRQFTTVMSPSVAAFVNLRRLPATSGAAKPFLGVGDPVLPAAHAGGAAALPAEFLLQGDGDGAADLRNLPPLPQTANELRKLAEFLGAGSDDVLLGPRATAAAVTAMPLKHYRVIAFATHALGAGRANHGEPALVLTPSPAGGAPDDGLLTASRISQLSLNAEWVILSACNTAAAQDAGGETLSGLARAFFYAGTRSLMVSHWAVESHATERLVEGLFDHLRRGSADRAAALRDAQLDLLSGVGMARDMPVDFAHPMFWGAFVVAGDDGLRRDQPGGALER